MQALRIQKPQGSSASWSVPKLAEVKGENPLGRTPALPSASPAYCAFVYATWHPVLLLSTAPGKKRMELQAVNTDPSLSMEASLLELVAAEKMAVS